MGSIVDLFPDSFAASASGQGAGKRRLLICFSHLRWDFVLQRPQHLMQRFASVATVVFWEEPVLEVGLAEARLDLRECPASGVWVATPAMPAELAGDTHAAELRRLLDGFVAGHDGELVRWYYTPMMLPFSRHLRAACTVYDCMDELTGFRFAPPELKALEQELFRRADAVFTGGYSLYEAKRRDHANIHPFPSSVDRPHFMAARSIAGDLADQRDLPRPRIGYYGVIDERLDLDLIADLADARPDWAIVMVGPVAKIDPADLPQRANIAYLGGKPYAELPAYLAGWDVAIMPFAINEATRFISPTKTPEYLAGGCPVVSTPIVDVVRHYGELEAVRIASGSAAFIEACDAALALAGDRQAWIGKVDAALASLSWDNTFAAMSAHIDAVVSGRASAKPAMRSVVAGPTRAAKYDYLVVGAGFAGSVMAERLAAGSNKRVLVIDKRPHIAGNAYDRHDDAGILMHQYGPHIFHTNSADIFDYLSRFTRWRPYEHRVLAQVDGQLVPMPINRTTLNMLYGLSLETDDDAEAFLASRAEPVDDIRTSEDVVVSRVGRDLYEKFFQGYSRKQWGIDPSELDKSVTARVPTRSNTDDRYFTDRFQSMPADGYTRMFENMLDHPNIRVMTGTTYADVRDAISFSKLVWTGPVDEYFGFRFGKLPYRSLEFRHESLDEPWFQSVGTVNYPAPETPYTRITEYKHLTGQASERTTITYEYPRAEGDPYYPIPRPENEVLYKRYEALALASDVTFVGRLATYRYYNMDQVVGQALAAYRRLVVPEPAAASRVSASAAAAS